MQEEDGASSAHGFPVVDAAAETAAAEEQDTMACASDEGLPGDQAAGRSLQGLPRKARKKMKKKLRRKQQRQAVARAQATEDKEGESPASAGSEEEAAAEAERRRQHELWEEAERQAQEARRLQLAREEERRIEQEAQEQKRKEVRMRQELLAQQFAMEAAAQHYGPDGSSNNCSYYMKTGACRFGTKCKYRHPIPARSTTILIKNMYDGLGAISHFGDEDLDSGLEHDEDKLMDDYRNFFYDVEGEMRSYGEVVQFKVCRNHGPHLRGNLYVQFRSEEEAERAARALHERYYGGKQIFVQFSPVVSWRSAICGQYLANRCSRGSQCIFLHPFRNPENAYAEADRDMHNRIPRERRPGLGRERSRSRERDRDDRRHSRHRDSIKSPSRERRRSHESSHRRSRSRSRSRREYRGRRGYDETRRSGRERRDEDSRRDSSKKRHHERGEKDEERLDRNGRTRRETEGKRTMERSDHNPRASKRSRPNDKERSLEQSVPNDKHTTS